MVTNLTTTQTTFSIDEYHAFCDRPENEGREFELIDGEIVEKDMASLSSSEIGGEIFFLLRLFLQNNRIGRLTPADGSYIINDKNILIPDVGYISNARMPVTPDREGPVAPDLAVEVMSPTDRIKPARKKAERYLAHGTRLVWLVVPKTRSVEVYTPDDAVIILSGDDLLTGGDVLPGFACRVADLFPV